MTTLLFLNGPRAGETLQFADGNWTLGRAADNSVVIPESSVSTHHARLLLNPGEVIVRDLGTTNGTFVAERRVGGQAPVGPGQELRLGAVRLRVDYAPPHEDHDATDVTAVDALRHSAG